MKETMGPDDKVICFHFSDSDATDSDATTTVISQSIPRQNKTQNPELQHCPQQRQPSSSKYPGVYKRQYGKWGARLGSGTRPWVGTFDTEEEAHNAIEKRKAEIAKAKAAARECELCQTAGQQCQSCQKPETQDSPQKRRPSSKYPGIYKRKYGKWGARIGSRTRLWLGTFPTEEEAHKAVEKAKAEIDKAKAAARECELCQTAGEQCQSCQKAAQPDQAMTPQMAAAAKSRVKKRKEKVEKKASTKVLTVLGPPTHSQFVVSEENVSTKNKKPKMDTICEADKSKPSVTSAAPVRVGSTPLVHDPSAMPQGFWRDFDLESIPDADLGIDNSNSGAEDPIQLDHLPLWTGNLDFGDWSFLHT